MIVNMLFSLSLAKVLENESYIELKENPFYLFWTLFRHFFDFPGINDSLTFKTRFDPS